jgi:hypothetical protein
LKALWHFIAGNWGSLTSVIGLVVSFATLLVACRAKQSADAAKAEARRRNRAEELREARTKSEQIGLFIHECKWDIVFLRAQEIAGACSMVLRRWNDDLTETSKNQIVIARDQAASVAKVAMRANRIPPTEQQMINISAAQRRLNELLNSELGESLTVIEGSGKVNDYGTGNRQLAADKDTRR